MRSDERIGAMCPHACEGIFNISAVADVRRSLQSIPLRAHILLFAGEARAPGADAEPEPSTHRRAET